MQYYVLLSDKCQDVILTAFNTKSGETNWMKFPKIGKCVEFCRRKNIEVPIENCILQEDFERIGGLQ